MKKTIMAIDDEFAVRYFYKISLERDFNIITLKDGNEAWDHLIKHPDVDLIVLDIMLPGIDGIQILKKIRENETTKKIPVIIVSAKHQSEITKECDSLGADAVIIKPFEPENLINKIKELVRR
ncbi:response regulator [Candidatus Woesearchaeota archaeon]|nr:response regulator [Candidatus Woesearchaeota archaeon]